MNNTFPLPLSPSQQALHEKAISLCRQYSRMEVMIIETLQKIDALKLYKRLGFSSLFQYAVGALTLSESVAYGFISVSRKAKSLVELQEAIKTQTLSVAKAQRMVSVLNNENASRLIEFASQHTSRDIDFEVARINPKAGCKDIARPLSEAQMLVKFSASREVYEKLKRVQSLVAQKLGTAPGFEQTLERVLDFYLERNDPKQKAQRAAQLQNEKSLCWVRVKPEYKTSGRKSQATSQRSPLKAHEKHAVINRDGGRCTHIDSCGERCANDRYLAIHHIQPVSAGGSNDPENLTTLCWYHHDIVHQLVLPIDGGMSWLRSSYEEYGLTKFRLVAKGESGWA